jgi:hypothetical protein
MFRLLKSVFGRDPDTEFIVCLKLYCDQLFADSLPELDLKALMNDPSAKARQDTAALRLVLGLYVVDLVGNASSMLRMDERSAVAALYYLYSDQFGLEDDAAEALREPAVALKDPAIERLEQDGEEAKLDAWPDEAALAVVFLAGTTAERICEEYRKNRESEFAPTEDEISNFSSLCSRAMDAAAGDKDAFTA